MPPKLSLNGLTKFIHGALAVKGVNPPDCSDFVNSPSDDR